VLKISNLKLGRPTDNPKIRRVQAKLDEDTNAILIRYCENTGVTESEAIRRAIRGLLNESKK
jgi:hypothetical protein